MEQYSARKFNDGQKFLFFPFNMRSILLYIKHYFHEINKTVLVSVTLFTGILIFSNYYFNVNGIIQKNNSFIIKLFGWYAVFLVAFAIPYLFYTFFTKRKYASHQAFLILVFSAPALFALKHSLDFNFRITNNSQWNIYWNHIIYWPLLALITCGLIYFIWKVKDSDQPFYGIKTKGINWKPYWIMLLIMLPLLGIASTQADFLAVYPKLGSIEGIGFENKLQWWRKLLFELSYGSDFITIELFFRGFLILAFIKWAGKDAILPMACFYCTIHFGKPLGECISSYFGGILLGIIVYNTRSILGGLLIHLGIAWMMELGGYLGNLN